jgi:hypothetical protein
MRPRNRRYRLLPLLAAGPIALCAGAASAGDRGWLDEYRWRGDSITIEHGNAIAHNIAVQTIDPWPRYAGKSRIDVDGGRLLIGVKRYKANKSIPPRGLTTQSIIVAPTGEASGN